LLSRGGGGGPSTTLAAVTRRIILQMPEWQHAVALLRWQLEMREAEIASVLGIAEKTVNGQLRAARRKLIAQLVPDDPYTRDDPEGASS